MSNRTNAAMRTVGLCVAAASVGVILAASTSFAQSATDIQVLKLEIEALKRRLNALQKEIDALKGQPRALPAATPLPPPIAPGSIVLRLDKAPFKGDAAARITLVEVSDFECPFCARHFRQTSQLIEKNYVETGKIRLAFLHFPIASHRNAFKASEAAACAADQGKFWEMHTRLFANQTQLLATLLPGHGAAVGLNPDRYRTCLESSTYAADVRNDMLMAQRAGVTATPTFFVGTLDPKTQTLSVIEKIVGAKPYPAFQQSLDAALARK